MYAVFESGGKQHRVREGETVKVELLDANEGDLITFDNVLLVSDNEQTRVGKPYVEGIKVQGRLLTHSRTKKIGVTKFKRRKNYLRRSGHRQNFSLVEIESISE